jgi:glutamate dehydrogenase (NAD(P)+)
VPPHERHRCTHVVTGKPVESGGSLGREKATGQGVVFLVEEWARLRDFALDKAAFIVQGFGNVGSWAARLLAQRGSKLVAAEDVTGAVADADGIDPIALASHVKATGGVLGYKDAKPIEHSSFLESAADIFIPAALENQITAETAGSLKVRLVAEGANGPTDPDGDRILRERGIDVIPDIVCNAGGVIVSYFEWLQNKRSEFADLEEIDGKLLRKMTHSYHRVIETSSKYGCDVRTGALILALSRLEKVYKERGIFP